MNLIHIEQGNIVKIKDPDSHINSDSEYVVIRVEENDNTVTVRKRNETKELTIPKSLIHSSLQWVALPKKPIIKQSDDCVDGKCPYEYFAHDDWDCEEMCRNCKYCPITCGHCQEMSVFRDYDGEYVSSCGYFEDNLIESLRHEREAVIYTIIPYLDGLRNVSSKEIIKEICEIMDIKVEKKGD